MGFYILLSYLIAKQANQCHCDALKVWQQEVRIELVFELFSNRSNACTSLLRVEYRPHVFDDVIGQETIVLALKNSIELERYPCAMVFSGVRGTGKTTLARIYAKALNCEHEDLSHRPCGVCESCNAIALGNHEDVLEIDGASHNGVDEVRQLQETLNYVTHRSPFRVYIIDEVHMLSTSAFNALLKTLEEPPEKSSFYFCYN